MTGGCSNQLSYGRKRRTKGTLTVFTLPSKAPCDIPECDERPDSVQDDERPGRERYAVPQQESGSRQIQEIVRERPRGQLPELVRDEGDEDERGSARAYKGQEIHGADGWSRTTV